MLNFFKKEIRAITQQKIILSKIEKIPPLDNFLKNILVKRCTFESTGSGLKSMHKININFQIFVEPEPEVGFKKKIKHKFILL